MTTRTTINTYTTTGDKDMIEIPVGVSDSLNYFTVKAGANDVYSLKVQMTKDSQIITHPNYASVSSDTIGSVPSNCYAIGLNIDTNDSSNIIIETFTE